MTLIRHRIFRRLIWINTLCLCPAKILLSTDSGSLCNETVGVGHNTGCTKDMNDRQLLQYSSFLQYILRTCFDCHLIIGERFTQDATRPPGCTSIPRLVYVFCLQSRYIRTTSDFDILHFLQEYLIPGFRGRFFI